MRDDAERLVKELTELIELAREVAEDEEARQKHEQLVAIGQTVAQLEKRGIPVPEDLRRLKGELAAGLSDYEQSSEALAYLRNQLPPVVRTLGITLGETARRPRRRKAEGASPRGDTTPPEVLRGWVVDAIAALGGSGTPSDVRQWIEQQHGQDLLPGDRERTARGEPVLHARLHWQRLKMIHAGQLKADTAPGVWELANHG